MILKISIHTNLYHVVICNFCEDVSMCWADYINEPEPEDNIQKLKWGLKYFQNRDFFFDVVKKHGSELSEEDKERVIRIVTDSFANFIREEEPQNADWFLNNFTCEIVDSVPDENEHAESFYVFPNSCGTNRVICF